MLLLARQAASPPEQVGILSVMTKTPVKGSVRKDGVKVRAHERVKQSSVTAADTGAAADAAAAAAADPAVPETGKDKDSALAYARQDAAQRTETALATAAEAAAEAQAALTEAEQCRASIETATATLAERREAAAVADADMSVAYRCCGWAGSCVTEAEAACAQTAIHEANVQQWARNAAQSFAAGTARDLVEGEISLRKCEAYANIAKGHQLLAEATRADAADNAERIRRVAESYASPENS